MAEATGRMAAGPARICLPLLALLTCVAPAALQAAPASPLPVQEGEAVDGDRVLTGDQTVEAGERVGDIVVVGGTLRVRGTVTGDAVVVGGDLILEEAGLIEGDALVTGGKLIDQGGRVRGEMRMLAEGDAELASGIKRAIVAGMSTSEGGREAARAARETASLNRSVRVSDSSSWFTPIKRGFAGLISTLALGLVLAGIGAALIFYGRSHLEVVSDTLRSSAVRAAGVGLAAGFLIVPAFVVMVVALAVSIVGIPLLLVAVPLYPLVIVAGAALGLLAGAHAIGERTAEQRRDVYDLRHRNAYVYLFTGLGMLLAPLLAAHLVGMTGFLGFVGTLLKVVTWVVIWAVTTAGFGAVILSRAGTRRSFVAPPLDPSFEPDPLFDDEPTAPGNHA